MLFSQLPSAVAGAAGPNQPRTVLVAVKTTAYGGGLPPVLTAAGRGVVRCVRPGQKNGTATEQKNSPLSGEPTATARSQAPAHPQDQRTLIMYTKCLANRGERQFVQVGQQHPCALNPARTPTFAIACERAYERAFVAVRHDRGAIRGFFPFQFRTAWHPSTGTVAMPI